MTLQLMYGIHTSLCFTNLEDPCDGSLAHELAYDLCEFMSIHVCTYN